MPREAQDPYAPPPRYKMRSGGLVRFAIIAALLGAAAWGYMEYAQEPQTALVSPSAEDQRLADSAYDAPQPALPQTPTAPAPQTQPAPSAAPV
jgi:hypothetical protein